jgi:hypothetical protein
VRHAGPTFVPALATLLIAGAVLFLSEATWLQMTAAVVLLLGIALGVFAIATPEYLAQDDDEDPARPAELRNTRP